MDKLFVVGSSNVPPVYNYRLTQDAFNVVSFPFCKKSYLYSIHVFCKVNFIWKKNKMQNVDLILKNIY